MVVVFRSFFFLGKVSPTTTMMIQSVSMEQSKPSCCHPALMNACTSACETVGISVKSVKGESLEFLGWEGLVSGGFFVVVDWLTRGIMVILMVYPP